MAEQHSHDEVVHEHDQIHITHYFRPAEETVHLTSTHAHEHNHPALTHLRAARGFEQEIRSRGPHPRPCPTHGVPRRHGQAEHGGATIRAPDAARSAG